MNKSDLWNLKTYLFDALAISQIMFSLPDDRRALRALMKDFLINLPLPGDIRNEKCKRSEKIEMNVKFETYFNQKFLLTDAPM
jgi:hypothetical protein